MYVLLSGGMDSLVVLALAVERFDKVVTAFYRYGQASWKQELAASRAMSYHYHVPLREEVLPHLGNPAVEMIVPHRNAVLIATTASLALGAGHAGVGGGWHATDAPDFPDCTSEFMGQMRRIIQPTHLWTPLQHLFKADIKRKGDELGVPWRMSWSCYRGDPTPCGECEACLRRNVCTRWK